MSVSARNSFHRAQSNAVMSSVSTIITPPIDGVPFLLTRAFSPPAASALSSYCWLNFNCFSLAMILGPSHQLKSSAVTAAPAVRNVMY